MLANLSLGENVSVKTSYLIILRENFDVIVLLSSWRIETYRCRESWENFGVRSVFSVFEDAYTKMDQIICQKCNKQLGIVSESVRLSCPDFKCESCPE